MKTVTKSRRRESWLEIYESHAQSQRTLARELTSVTEMLARFDEGFRMLLSDEQFVTLLRAEGLKCIPTAIKERIR